MTGLEAFVNVRRTHYASDLCWRSDNERRTVPVRSLSVAAQMDETEHD